MNPRHITVRTAAGAMALALAAVALAGCSGGSDPKPGRPAAGARIAPDMVTLMKQIDRRTDLSPFEREVLTRSIKSGQIADADYEEAHDRYARCVTQAGYKETYTKLANGVYQVHYQPGAAPSTAQAKAWFDATGECAKGTLAMIESLYTLQQGNPDLLANPREVVVQCLVQEGLAPADYTVAKLDKDLETALKSAPFKAKDLKVQTCLSNGGLAVGVS